MIASKSELSTTTLPQETISIDLNKATLLSQGESYFDRLLFLLYIKLDLRYGGKPQRLQQLISLIIHLQKSKKEYAFDFSGIETLSYLDRYWYSILLFYLKKSKYTVINTDTS